MTDSRQERLSYGTDTIDDAWKDAALSTAASVAAAARRMSLNPI